MHRGTVEAIAAQKRALRAGIRASRAIRAALPADDPARLAEGRALARAVLEGAAAAVARAADDGTPVCSYESLPSEPPTRELHEELAARGLTVLVPLLLPDKDLDWIRWLPRDHSEHGEHGETPPLGPNTIGRARLIVVPALAVDGAGTRLGQGGGSYDRALARRHPQSRVVALIDAEPSAQLPTLPHDQAVDAVASATGGWRDVGLHRAPGGAPP